MRASNLTTLLSLLVAGTPQDASAMPSGGSVSTPTLDAQSVTSSGLESLKLRQAPGVAVPAVPPVAVAPANPGVVNPLAVPPADPALPVQPGVANPVPVAPVNLDLPVPPGVAILAPVVPVDPARPIAPGAVNLAAPIITPTATANPATSALTGADYYTVQWVETWIGGTSRTWVPKTILFHFEPMTPAPQPGVGKIGMGTLTGKAGQTKTLYLPAAAPTLESGWSGGAVAAVAAGIVGMIV